MKGDGKDAKALVRYTAERYMLAKKIPTWPQDYTVPITKSLLTVAHFIYYLMSIFQQILMGHTGRQEKKKKKQFEKTEHQNQGQMWWDHCNNQTIISFFFFLLKDNSFTEFCCFLSNLNMNQPSVYICPLPLEPPSHLPAHPTSLGWYRSPVWVYWDIQQIPIGYLFYIW